MNNQSYGPGSPKPFLAYPRGDFELESGNSWKVRKSKNLQSEPLKMFKSIGNRIYYFYKLHPAAIFLISLSFGVTILIVLSAYESRFRMMGYRKIDDLSLGSGSYPFANLHNLVMVAGHSIYTSSSCGKTDREDSWFLEPYQKHPGQAATFLLHIKEGVEIAAKDEGALLLFSGGETRKDAGPQSEAQSYWTVAESKGWFGKQDIVRSRALTEEHARDSFENLLFSVCRFRELTGAYPHNITVVSYDYKEERFVYLHRSAIGFPEGRFFFFGTPTSPTTKEAAKKGEASVRIQFQDDPYGCLGSLHLKKLKRDPFHRTIPYPNGCPELKGLFSYCGPVPYPGILVKGMYELWGQGSSYEELEKAIRDFPDERKLPYLTSESTFRIIVDSFGKVISFQEQNERIQGLSYIPFKGRVDLRNPDHKFYLMETDNYGSNNGLPPIVQRAVFFGREVGAADRKLLPTYQLKSRKYLGPTAMDAEVAFLMANQGLAQPGKLVYDPFVGTGSILVAAAHFGAMTMGADIDIRVVRDGRGPDCNVWSNFKQYNLPMPISLLRADNNLPPWHPGLREVFDAIICDPPYGVRAGGRKSGGRKLLKGIVGPYTVPEEKRTDHIPSTAPYSLVECMHDLLDLSAKMLVMGGRLVFFYPVVREDGFTNAEFPEHPCFTLVASSEQILSLRYSRNLLTMVKTGPYTEEIAEAARKKHLEFKENHLKWLEDGNLRSAVFSPAHPQISLSGNSKFDRDSKPKYRGKYV